MTEQMNEQIIKDANGNKVGIVVREGAEWVAYSLSDLEVYRGDSYLIAAWTLNDMA